jgi:hypothetical protein
MAHAHSAVFAEDRAEWNGLFSRVGSELRTLAEAVNTFQHFLAPLVADVVGRDPDAIRRLQDLDFLEQSLHNLSEFVCCLDASTTLTDVSALDTGVKTIRLSGLARRLSATDGLREPEVDASGLDLF